MGKGPKPPDPYATAQAQGNANFMTAQQNAIMGNVNEYTPYGNKTYQQIGWDPVYDSSGKMSYAPRYQSNIQLSPDQMRLLGQQTGIQYNIGNLGLSQSSRLQGLLGHEMNTQGLQGWNAGPAAPKLATGFANVGGPQRQIGAGGAIRQDQTPTNRPAVENAMMASYNRARAPSIRAEEAQMAARGMAPGSQGYGTMQQGREDAAGEAARQAYLASGQESRAAEAAYNQAQAQRFSQGAAQGTFANQAQQQAYQQAMQRAGFSNEAIANMFGLGGQAADRQNALRQQQLTERIALRNQPINEIMALLGGSGVTTPQFQPFAGPNMQAPNIGQMIYDNYNAQSQQSAAGMSGMFGLGQAAIGALPLMMMMSDRRLKQDIEPLKDQTFAGLPLYKFRYRHDPAVLQVGVMSDDVRELHPDAVSVGDDGYDRVDYGLLMRRHQDG